MDIELKLKLDEVNGIISVLAMLPFTQVNDLLQKVRNQAIEQVSAAQAAEETSDTTEA